MDIVNLENVNKFKIFKGFDTSYYKVGQLLKVCAIDMVKQKIIKIDYGFISNVTFDEIILLMVNSEGKQEFKHLDYKSFEVNANSDIKMYIEVLNGA